MISSLQSLRFIFALMIFFHHYQGMFPAGGACGVAFFMILSGFVMSAGYDGKVSRTDFNYKNFIFKRLIRIYPLHLLCLVFFTVVRIFRFDILDYIKLIPNFLLLQSWIPVKSIYFSGNAVSWCLSDMLFFYAMFPLLSKCFNECSRKNIFTVGILVFTTYLFIAILIPESYRHQFLYISPIFRLIDFIIGMCVFRIYIKISNSDINKKLQNLSLSSKSLVELALITILIIPILLYPYISKSFYYSFIWWFIMPGMILYFALFNKRGGIFKSIKP